MVTNQAFKIRNEGLRIARKLSTQVDEGGGLVPGIRGAAATRIPGRRRLEARRSMPST
jgi:hypothetical protein